MDICDELLNLALYPIMLWSLPTLVHIYTTSVLQFGHYSMYCIAVVLMDKWMKYGEKTWFTLERNSWFYAEPHFCGIIYGTLIEDSVEYSVHLLLGRANKTLLVRSLGSQSTFYMRQFILFQKTSSTLINWCNFGSQ